MIEDKSSTWQKSSRESLKREQEVLCLAEGMKSLGTVDENSRVVMVRALKRSNKLRKEEETLKELLVEVQDQKKQQKVEMWKEFRDYMASWGPEKTRTNTLSTKIWQMTQSNATKTENLENDFMDLSTKSTELGWFDGMSNPRAWLQKA